MTSNDRQDPLAGYRPARTMEHELQALWNSTVKPVWNCKGILGQLCQEFSFCEVESPQSPSTVAGPAGVMEATGVVHPCTRASVPTMLTTVFIKALCHNATTTTVLNTSSPHQLTQTTRGAKYYIFQQIAH